MKFSDWLKRTIQNLRQDNRKRRSWENRSRAAVECLEDRALLANFTPGDVTTLIANINTANANGEDDVIDLGGGVFTLDDTNFANDTTDGRNGLPSILQDSGHALTIQNGSIERDAGAMSFRLLHVDESADLNLQQISLSGGLADQPLGVNLGRAGGAVFVSSGAVMSIADSTISGNTADPAATGFGLGGALFNSGSTTISRTTLSNNSTDGLGGAIYNSGPLVLVDSAVSDNSADSVGGGIRSRSTLTISGSTISGNSARTGRGGGADIFGGGATITNSTISGNSAGGNGGGIYHRSGAATIANSTISGNSAGNRGGGIYNYARTTINNTIVAGNTGGRGAPDVGRDLQATSANNLIGDAGAAGGLTHGVNGNIVGNAGTGTLDINTILNTTLADNGGPTFTHALVADSPAIDAGDNALLPADTDDLDDDSNITEPIPFDQRGETFDRILGGVVDIGAIESPLLPQAATIASVSFYNQDATLEANLSPDSTGQRSIIQHVQVVIDGDITVPTGAITNSSFALTNLTASTNVGLSVDSVNESGDSTTIVLSFTSGTDLNGSLTNGNYRLIIDGALLGVDADGSGSVGGSRTVSFHRLFGDSDGDRDVDGSDFVSLIRGFYGNPAFQNVFDQDDDGNLFEELGSFFSSFGRRLNPF